MRTYFSKDGKVIGRGWSVMQCKSIEDHGPHTHDPRYALYGPYLCAGYPQLDLYDTPDRKPVNALGN